MNPRPVEWSCPECGEVIVVASHTSTSNGPGTVLVKVVPDLADAWAHVWSHTEVAT